MDLFKHIWRDIRQGEKIDVYVLIFVAVILALLTVLDIVPDSWVPPVTLGVLALLAFSILNIRYSLEEVHTKLSPGTESGLLDRFTEDMASKIEKEASEIWMLGASLGYIFETYYGLFETKLQEGCLIKVLVRDPNEEMCQLASRYTYTPARPEQIKSKIETTLHRLCQLKKVAPERLEVRVLDYPLSFNIGAINPQRPSGSIYVEYHPYKMRESGLPKLIIKPQDRFWYTFYMTQIHTIWEDGKVWRCDNRNG